MIAKNGTLLFRNSELPKHKNLKSLNDLRIISQKDIESIYGNINTVIKELHADNLTKLN